MSSLPRVSVIIPTRNRPDEVARTVAALHLQTGVDAEIIIFDDGSDPPLPPLPVSRQLRSDGGVGLCAGRNRAAAAATAEVIVNLDDDAVPASTTLLRDALETAERFPGAGMIGFRQRTPDGSLHYLQPVHCDVICRAPRFFGYGFLIRSEVMKQLGGFYEPLNYYGEDLEMSLRVLDAGHEILYAPNLEVVHHESQRERNWERIERLTLRNLLCICLLRYPWWMVLPGMIIHLRRALAMSRKRGTSRTALVRHALIGTAAMLPRVFRDRRPVAFRVLRLTRRLGRSPERLM